MMTWLRSKKGEKYSLPHIALLQAAALVAYITVVANIMMNADRIFGKMETFLAPVLFITLFSTSALLAGLITLGYPIILIWDKKRAIDGVRLIAYTAGWLVAFIAIIFLGLFLKQK